MSHYMQFRSSTVLKALLALLAVLYAVLSASIVNAAPITPITSTDVPLTPAATALSTTTVVTSSTSPATSGITQSLAVSNTIPATTTPLPETTDLVVRLKDVWIVAIPALAGIILEVIRAVTSRKSKAEASGGGENTKSATSPLTIVTLGLVISMSVFIALIFLFPGRISVPTGPATQYQEVNESLGRLQQQVTESSSNVAKVQQQLADSMTKLSLYESKIQDVDAKLEAYKTDLKKNESSLISATQSISVVQANIDELRRSIPSAGTILSNYQLLTTSADMLANQYKDLEAEMSSTRLMNYGALAGVGGLALIFILYLSIIRLRRPSVQTRDSKRARSSLGWHESDILEIYRSELQHMHGQLDESMDQIRFLKNELEYKFDQFDKVRGQVSKIDASLPLYVENKTDEVRQRLDRTENELNELREHVDNVRLAMSQLPSQSATRDDMDGQNQLKRLAEVISGGKSQDAKIRTIILEIEYMKEWVERLVREQRNEIDRERCRWDIQIRDLRLATTRDVDDIRSKYKSLQVDVSLLNIDHRSH